MPDDRSAIIAMDKIWPSFPHRHFEDYEEYLRFRDTIKRIGICVGKISKPNPRKKGSSRLYVKNIMGVSNVKRKRIDMYDSNNYYIRPVSLSLHVLRHLKTDIF